MQGDHSLPQCRPLRQHRLLERDCAHGGQPHHDASRLRSGRSARDHREAPLAQSSRELLREPRASLLRLRLVTSRQSKPEVGAWSNGVETQERRPELPDASTRTGLGRSRGGRGLPGLTHWAALGTLVTVKGSTAVFVVQSTVLYVRMFTARAATRSTVTAASVDSAAISALAGRVSGMASVGLKAVALVSDT
jgi:hypothetical protein